MRWNSHRYFLKDRVGETRIRRKFLIIPCRFFSKRWRWLEYADVVEKICEVDVGGHDEWGGYAYHWVEIGFADELEDANEQT